MDDPSIGFIGGGHMARALIGGLLKNGRDPASVLVVEPAEAARRQLAADLGVVTLAGADRRLATAATIVWAVKPQVFDEAVAPCAPHVARALHLSVMAGVRTERLRRATGSERIVRAMPNTPALIGQGVAGLYARDAVTPAGRAEVQSLLAPTGQLLWVAREDDLDAVTALSGSGPAYVFYVLEAMLRAAGQMGLDPAQARTLALGTLAGATALAQSSSQSPQALREQVTSKGGTTHAAISALEADGVGDAFVRAILAAQQRARELGA